MTSTASRYSNKGDLTTGSISRHLIRLTLPTIWGILAIILVQLTDTYFVSLMGTKELAGISFTFPVTLTLTHLVFGFNIAMSSVVSRMAGAGQNNDLRRIVTHGLALGVFVSCIIALITYISIDTIFTAMGTDPESLTIVKEYMPFWLLGYIVLAIPSCGNSAMRAGGDSMRPAIIMTAIAGINIILDPLLIFGLYGFPELGVKGAAIATTIAQFSAMLLGFYFLIKHKNMIALDGLHLDKLKDSIKRLGIIALPAGITTSIHPFTNIIIVSVLAVYGPDAVAAYGVATRVEALAMVVIFALSVALAPVVGQNWGAKKYDRVDKSINLAIGFNLFWSLGVAIILILFAHPVAEIFTTDPKIIHYIKQFFWIIPITYGIGNMVFGWSSAFNAIGRPKRSFVMIVIRSVILTIPCVYIGSTLYGVQGIFCALATVNIVTGLYFHWSSRRACHRCQAEESQPA